MDLKTGLVFLLLSSRLYSSPAITAGEPFPRVDHLYCLTYLLAQDESQIISEISRLEPLLETDSMGRLQTDHVTYAAGVLHIYRYIRSGRRDDAMKAKRLLEAVEDQFGNDKLFIVHLGMAHAFVASIRTVFGVGDLKKMQTELQSIEKSHPDWVIRLLRGITLVEVGRALPGIFTIREIKNQAVEVGTEDLRFVLSLPRLRPAESFDPETYDLDKMPVPWDVVTKAESVLAGD